MKNYLVQKYHIPVLLVHWYILQIIHDHILHSLLTYLRDIILHQLKDIGIESSMYYDNISLFYSKGSKSQLFWYVDVDYLSNPYKTHSQIGYVFTYSSTTISGRIVKPTMKTCGLLSIRGNATKLYKR